MSAFLRSVSRAVARPQASSARAFSSTAQRPYARITIVGNLADTPELRASQNGKEYLRYSVASNTGSGDKQKTSWFNVTAFVNSTNARDYQLSLEKGTLVLVEGTASIDSYEDGEGKPMKTLGVVQRNLEVLRRPSRENIAAESE
ncbi:hypothetical protein QBC40DRAFT_287227 [Triangularia verruculosa]|uniref:SsDNA binding protein n=1 Tax=Triangularia verruculosa TaxID=2587418 RepID=A0AAN6X9B8_9PEZI|nr:hypothetical protein QBC40DRAFT_287227 [Triangularia verruculosa]